MRRNNLFAKFIITLTLVALLTVPVGRVTGVFALAVTPELQPVYDTKVIQLQDYVDNVLTDAQVGMFNTLMGTYAASQAGLNDYDLEYPYNDSDGVVGWLQRMGQKLYDTIIEVSQNPIIKYSDPRTYLNIAVDYALGVAQSIRKYATFQDLMDDIDASTHYFIPISPELQASINSYVGLQNGFYDWQFDDSAPFISDFTWDTVSLGSYAASYNTAVANLSSPHVKVNRNYYITSTNTYFHNCIRGNLSPSDLCIFLNSSTGAWAVMSESQGLNTNGVSISFDEVQFRGAQTWGNDVTSVSGTVQKSGSVNLSNYSTLLDAVHAIYNNTSTNAANTYWCLSDVTQVVYVGDSWATKHRIYNLTDLNLAQNNVPSYDQVQTDMLIDIKGLLVDLVNQIDLNAAIIANLFNPDGTLNINPSFLKVSIELPDDIVIYGTEPMPVDLNDIQYYTENEYLDVVKERVNAFSDTVGSFVAFWHNTDFEIVYAVFGSALIVLLGAFIGKWGHS